MKQDVPKPSRKLTLVIRESHDQKLRKIALHFQKITGGKMISSAGIIDFLLARIGVTGTAEEIAAKIRGDA